MLFSCMYSPAKYLESCPAECPEFEFHLLGQFMQRVERWIIFINRQKSYEIRTVSGSDHNTKYLPETSQKPRSTG